MRIKKVEDGHGLMKLVRFALIPIEFELTVLENDLVHCIIDYGRIIIGSDQYDFKSSDIDTNFSFYFRRSLIDGIEFIGGVTIYLDCVIFTKEKVTPEFLLDELQKSHVNIISAGSILLPNPSEISHDKEYLFGNSLDALEEGLYDITIDKVVSIHFEQSLRDITLTNVVGSINVENGSIPLSTENCMVYLDKHILPSSFKCAVSDICIDDLNIILPFLKLKAFIGPSADDPEKKVIKINRVENLKTQYFIMEIPFNKISDIFKLSDSNMFCIKYTDSYDENKYNDGISNILRHNKNVNAYIDDTITKLTNKIMNPLLTRKIYIPLREYQRHKALFDVIESGLYNRSPRSKIKLCIESYTSYPEYTNTTDECYIINDIRIESISFEPDVSN